MTRRHDLIDSIRQDAQYALRKSVLQPGFSLAVVLTLGFGIGATAGVFSLIDTVLLRPLPFPDSNRLFLVLEQDSIGARQLASYPTYLDWHDQADVFDGLTFVRGTALSFGAGEKTNFVLASFVTEEFFRVFEIAPVIGRTLGPADFRDGAPAAVVVSHDVWVRALGADPDAIGRTVRVDEVVATVVGVLPPTFGLPQWTPTSHNDIWLSLHTLPAADRSALMQRDFHADSRVVARLAHGVNLEAAQAAMNAIARRLASTYPETSRRWTQIGFIPQRDMIVGDVAPRLLVLGAAVATILLICCVNLANLFLSRGAARNPEFAIRTAIGAGRGRIFRQLLIESLFLCAVGAAAGIGVAFGGVRLLRARLPTVLPRLHELAIDWPVVFLSLMVTAITAVVFAVVSVRQIRASNLVESLHQSGSSPVGRTGHRVRAWLVASQVALSTVLLVGAGLLMKSLARLNAADLGFDPTGLAITIIEPRLPQYQNSVAARDLYQRIAQAISTVPGVRQVGLINHAPVGGGGITSRASLRGDPRAESADEIIVFFRTVSAGYFDLMGIPILAGREFSTADEVGPPGPLIVNETLARYWGSESPIDAPLAVLKSARDRADFGEPLFGRVIGVVGDVKHFGPDAAAEPVVYVPYTHNVWSHITVLARSDGDPRLVLEGIEDAIHTVEPGIPMEGLGLGVSVVTDGLQRRLAARRLNTMVVVSFATAALLLALVGVYGVTSYAVASDTREIGIRLALGADPAGVSRLVVARTAKVIVTGLVAGVVAGLLLTRYMRGVLFDVEANDPGTFVLVSGVLLTAGIVAGYLPSRRAARVDPVTTLKS